MNDIAVVEARPMELSIQEVKDHARKIHDLMAEMMVEGAHYGASFSGDPKKNLLKPGADKLMFIFRLRPEFRQKIKELPNGHREVLTRCEIYHIESGLKIAEGVGSASTMESKYRWRHAARTCPHCGKEAIIKGKDEFGGGWVCYVKKGGCGVKFADGDASIEKRETGKIENPDIADVYNTVVKMSKKRAYVDAAITACAASDIFTQDLDDVDAEGGIPQAPHDAERLAEGAARQERSPREAVPPAVRRRELGKELAAIMTAKNPDGIDYFTEGERRTARAALEKSGPNPQGAAVLEGAVKKWGEELEKRKAAFVPIPFSDEEDDDFRYKGAME